MTKEDIFQKIPKAENLYVAYSMLTRLPYVHCDEESYNDQVFVFFDEADLKNFISEKQKEKIPLMGMKHEQKGLVFLWFQFFSLSVNAVVFISGTERLEMELEEIYPTPDFSKLPPQNRPFLNPALQLCGIYFMQELRRPVQPQERGNIRPLEEELIANIRKSKYLIPFQTQEEDPKKTGIPLLKGKNGDSLQPVFSDTLELGKLFRGKKFKFRVISFEQLGIFLAPQAKAYLLNPGGISLVLEREQLKRMGVVFKENPAKPAEEA